MSAPATKGILDGKKTHGAAAVQVVMGIVGIACFLRPDLVGYASAIGVTVLTPDQSLLSLAFGVSQIVAGIKSMASRAAIAKIGR